MRNWFTIDWPKVTQLVTDTTGICLNPLQLWLQKTDNLVNSSLNKYRFFSLTWNEVQRTIAGAGCSSDTQVLFFSFSAPPFSAYMALSLYLLPHGHKIAAIAPGIFSAYQPGRKRTARGIEFFQPSLSFLIRKANPSEAILSRLLLIFHIGQNWVVQ